MVSWFCRIIKHPCFSTLKREKKPITTTYWSRLYTLTKLVVAVEINMSPKSPDSCLELENGGYFAGVHQNSVLVTLPWNLQEWWASRKWKNLKKPLIITQILHVSTIANVWRTVRRAYTLMLGSKGFNLRILKISGGCCWHVVHLF